MQVFGRRVDRHFVNVGRAFRTRGQIFAFAEAPAHEEPFRRIAGERRAKRQDDRFGARRLVPRNVGVILKRTALSGARAYSADIEAAHDVDRKQHKVCRIVVRVRSRTRSVVGSEQISERIGLIEFAENLDGIGIGDRTRSLGFVVIKVKRCRARNALTGVIPRNGYVDAYVGKRLPELNRVCAPAFTER